MKSLGQAGAAMPRVKPGDYERALALIVELGGDKATRKYLAELAEAEAAQVKARGEAETAAAEAKRRGEAAQAAEADATRARQALADETEKARTDHNTREAAVAEREQRATALEQSQDARDEQLTQREGHLREAGVAGF